MKGDGASKTRAAGSWLQQPATGGIKYLQRDYSVQAGRQSVNQSIHSVGQRPERGEGEEGKSRVHRPGQFTSPISQLVRVLLTTVVDKGKVEPTMQLEKKEQTENFLSYLT